MRDWKQEDQSNPCRRTVLRGLVGLASLGSGIIWLTRACSSSSDPARGTLLFTYKGHSGGVMTVAWSPDGKRIVSSADDSTVQVWNATDGSHIYFLNVMLVLAISAVGGAFIYLFKHYMRILAHVPMLVYELTFYVASLSSALIGWWLPVPMHQSLALLACVLFAGALAFSVGYRRELAHVFIIVMILFLVWTPMAMLFTSPFISFFAIGALLAALGWNDFVLWAINELGAHVRSGFSQQIEHATLAGFVVLTLFLCLIHPTKHASVPDKYSCI